MKRNFFSILTFIVCLMVFFSTTFAFAATNLMTYNGRGIRDKDSVETFVLSQSTTITLEHSTTGVTDNGTQPNEKCQLLVSLMKKGTFSYAETGDEIRTTGIESKSATWTKAKGTYKLHFATKMLTETWWPGANIEGRIYK